MSVAVFWSRDGSKRKRPGLRYVILSIFAIPWVVLPLWLMVVNSLKTTAESGLLDLGLPQHWAAGENYRTVLDQGNYLTGLGNSLLIAIPTIFVVLLLGSMAAWGYGRSRSRLMQIPYYVTSLSILLPPAIIPTIYLLTDLGINGTRLGYALTVTATRLGMVVFLTTGFIRSLPVEVEEAAAIDGAGRIQVYRHVILPMISPVLFVGGVILAINVWNDFFFALFLLQGTDRATLPLTLFQFSSATLQTVRWNLVFAHVVLTSLPLLLVYVFAQKRVLQGLTEGGVKG